MARTSHGSYVSASYPYIPGAEVAAPPYRATHQTGASSWWHRMLAGALAGCAATVPMTAVMETGYRLLAPGERYPLQPALVTGKLASLIGLNRQLTPRERVGLTLVMHFGYGTVTGVPYALGAARIPLPRWLTGIAYGLLVYAGSYLGLLPALNLLRPATDFPKGRNRLLIAAHIAWGTTLGLVTTALLPGRGRRR